MGKRSDFERIPRDFYPTPEAAVLPLLSHLVPATRFHEPCAGDGALIAHLAKQGHICAEAGDVELRASGIEKRNALDLYYCKGDCFITNPPWDRKVLHPLIAQLSDIAPTWLLFDADWMHTKQSVPFRPRLLRIVSVGRVKWIPDSTMTGKDNCCWYLFGKPRHMDFVPFYGRT